MDDKFHRNQKVRALRRMKGGRDALGVWTFWWSWCLDDAELTGAVPADELGTQDAKAAKLLVAVGLWDVVAGGYAFHDFDQYNPTSEQVAAKRAADRERVAAKRAAEKGASRSNVASDNDATSRATHLSVASTRDPIPSHPIPASKLAGDPASPEDIHREWGAAAADVAPLASHSLHSWRADFETVAGACNAVDGDPQTAVSALCRWFWHAPTGPVQGGRIKAHLAKPSHLAKHVGSDLFAASEWFATQEAAQ
jgi:hypothetical protein